MSSRTLYPPITKSFEPAFIAGSQSQLKVYFSLSSLSVIPNGTQLTVHASIMRKDGVKVVNTANDVPNGRYRATGIILNLIPQRDESLGDNYYYIVINNDDLKSSVTLNGTTYTGWIPGWTYKIQLRLSTVTYPGGTTKQAAWLQEYSNSFSEWSTICYTKAIGEMALQIPIFDYDSTDKTQEYNPDTVHNLTKLDFFGSLSNTIIESNEQFESCRVRLYQDDALIEDSGDIFQTELSDSYFAYSFKTNFVDGLKYEIRFTYITENGYQPTEPLVFLFNVNLGAIETINAQIVTIDTNLNNILDGLTSIDLEEDEGRIGLKLYSTDTNPYSGNICIRRSSQEDNFATWEDITIFTLKGQVINDYPIIYDYTIQSGVWYKYGVQSITANGERGVLVEMSAPIQRLFNYSYLLGQGGKQLKLSFDNTMNSFKTQVLDSKIETIGSKYPFISRNAAVNYRTFPINGLISFWMDDNNTFLTNGKKDVYQYSSIVNNYEAFNLERGIIQRDFTYERDFRKLVLDFLSDGKPKLFKSPTEGNIIVRLMDVNCTPSQPLDRLVYSFTSNANEIADNTMTNYLSYGFYNPGTYSTDFSVEMTYLGQLDGTFSIYDNLFKLIYEKYDSQNKNYGGYRRTLKSISRVKITITDPPLRILNNSGELVIGNNFKLTTNGRTSTITIYDPRGIYEFDSLMKFHYSGNSTSGNDELYLLGDEEGLVTEVNATIDFLYNLSVEPYVEHEIKERTPSRGIGQFFEEVQPGTSIFNMIYYKYYIESDSKFRYLNNISSIEIEANPHTVFLIKDRNDTEAQYHEVGDTGVLRLYELNNIIALTYVGKRYIQTDYDDSTVSSDIITTDVKKKDINGNEFTIKAAADVMITYRYTAVEGWYKE